MTNNEVNELISVESVSTSPQKKVGRKFIVAIIGIITGILTAIVNNSSEIVSIAGLLLVCISSVSYMITEGKLDLASIQKVITSADQIVDIVDEMDLPCLDDEENSETPTESEDEACETTDEE